MSVSKVINLCLPLQTFSKQQPSAFLQSHIEGFLAKKLYKQLTWYNSIHVFIFILKFLFLI